MQDKKDFMHQLTVLLKLLYLYQHLLIPMTDKPWTFEDPEYDETQSLPTPPQEG